MALNRADALCNSREAIWNVVRFARPFRSENANHAARREYGIKNEMET